MMLMEDRSFSCMVPRKLQQKTQAGSPGLYPFLNTKFNAVACSQRIDGKTIEDKGSG